MMMVDTINPSTDQPDAFVAPTTAPISDPGASNADHFYGGFDKPDEVKINLAGAPAESFTPTPQASSVEMPLQPAYAGFDTSASQPVVSADSLSRPQNPVPSTPSETKMHDSYANNSPVNTRGILVIAGIGIVAILIAGFTTFYIVGSGNDKKIAEQKKQLDELNSKLTTLSAVPEALTLPETPVVVEDPVETPVEVTPPPVETPVEVPAVETPKDSGNEEKNGSLG